VSYFSIPSVLLAAFRDFIFMAIFLYIKMASCRALAAAGLNNLSAVYDVITMQL